MNNITVGLKKFLSNKNTVTVIGVLLAVVILYAGYNIRVRQATNPVTVPYATRTISPGVKITEDMVGTTEVPPAMIKGSIVGNVSAVIGKYTSVDSVIPEGSLFYTRSVVEEEQSKNSILLDYPKGYSLYNFPVNMESTYGNLIYPGNYIDIYLKANMDSGNGASVPSVGKLLENVKVLAVQDSQGQSVFANLDDPKTPAMLIFAVPEKYHLLLRKAAYLSSYDAELIPVPTSESLKKNPGEVDVSNKELENFINSATSYTG